LHETCIASFSEPVSGFIAGGLTFAARLPLDRLVPAGLRLASGRHWRPANGVIVDLIGEAGKPQCRNFHGKRQIARRAGEPGPAAGPWPHHRLGPARTARGRASAGSRSHPAAPWACRGSAPRPDPAGRSRARLLARPPGTRSRYVYKRRMIIQVNVVYFIFVPPGGCRITGQIDPACPVREPLL
jgi:hypothetical protein